MFQARSGAAVAILLALSGCNLPWQPPAPAPSDQAAAPDYSLGGFDGRRHTLSEYRGKVVVLNFWATWCIPCRAEIPDLEHEARTQDSTRVAIVGIDWKEAPDPVQSFIRELGVTYPMLLDGDGAVYDRYQVDALPQTFFISREGRVATSRTGITSRDQLEAEIRAVAG